MLTISYSNNLSSSSGNTISIVSKLSNKSIVTPVNILYNIYVKRTALIQSTDFYYDKLIGLYLNLWYKDSNGSSISPNYTKVEQFE